MRVAPGGDARSTPGRADPHLEQHAPWGAQVTVTPGDVGQPYAIDATGPVYDAARAAFRQAWGAEAVDTGVGGSIPFIAEFADAFPEAKILVTGVEDPATQAHSINESLHLGVLERAATAEALLLAEPGRAQTDRSRRSLATWPVARTLYWATSILPFSSTTNVERMTPWTVLPYIFFSPKAPHAVEHLAVGVGQQRERQLLGVAELREFLRLVGGDADDVEAGVVQLGEAVAEVAGLLGASRGRGGRVEVHDDLAALEVGQT